MSELGETWQRPGDGRASAWIDLFERVPPPPAEELAWAAAMDASERTLTAAEERRYAEIVTAYLASRRQMPGPSPAELEWLLNLQRRFQTGEPPSQAEQERIWDISARFLLEQQEHLTTELAGVTALEYPTDDDLNWARQLQLAAGQGQPPSAEDYQRFLRLLKSLI